MFGLFSRKKQKNLFDDPKFMAYLAGAGKKAPSQAERRQKVADALGSEGLAFSSDLDATQFSSCAVAACVKGLMARNGCDLSRLDVVDVWTGMFFATVYSSHLALYIGVPFETTACQTHIILFGTRVTPEDLRTLQADVTESYNDGATTGKAVPDIGQRFADWINKPTPETFAMMAKSYAWMHEATKKNLPAS